MPYSSPQQVMDDIEELVPFYQRSAHSDSEREDPGWAGLESGGLAARRRYRELSPNRFGRFFPVEYIPPTDVPGDGYPLTLISGSILYHFGSGTRSSRSSRLKKFSPHAWVETSLADAEHLGLSDGDVVSVVSATGKVTTTVRVTETLPLGMLFMPISFPESPANELFSIALDSRAKTPSLKRCAVRLERIDSDG